MNSVQKTLDALESAQYTHDANEGAIYAVQYGDTLSDIISDHYNIGVNDPQYKIAEASALYFNEKIDDPNRLRAGDIIRLMAIPRPEAIKACPVPDDFYKQKQIATRHQLEPLPSHSSAYIRDSISPDAEDEQAAFFTLAGLYEHRGGLLVSAGAGVNAFGNIVGHGSDALLKELSSIHEQYYNKQMKRADFVARKQALLKQLTTKIGPFQSDLFGGRLGNQMDLPRYTSKRRGLQVSTTLDMHASKLSRLSKYATRGGVVLAAAGAAIACNDIANTDNQQEKNEILVETTVSTIVGFTTSAVIGVALLSNPVGWGVAIVLGAGAAVGSWQAGLQAKKYYNTFEEKIDFASISGIDKLCS